MTPTTARRPARSGGLGGLPADLHAGYAAFLSLSERRELRTLCRAA